MLLDPCGRKIVVLNGCTEDVLLCWLYGISHSCLLLHNGCHDCWCTAAAISMCS